MQYRPSPASFEDPRLAHYTSMAPFQTPPAQSRNYTREDAALYARIGVWPFPPPSPDLEGVAAGTMRPPPGLERPTMRPPPGLDRPTMRPPPGVVRPPPSLVRPPPGLVRPPPGLERPIDSRYPGLQHPPRRMVGPNLAGRNPPPGLEVHTRARQSGLRPPPGLESGTTLDGAGDTQLPTADGMSARSEGDQGGLGIIRDNGHLARTALPTADGPPLYAPRARLPRPSHAERLHGMCAAAEEARERSATLKPDRKPDSEEDRRLWKTGLRDIGGGEMVVMNRVTGEERRKRQRAARLQAEAAEKEELLEKLALLESLEEQKDTAEGSEEQEDTAEGS